MAIVILIASVLLLFNQLFTPQPIQIILETGQEVTTQSSDYFSLIQVLLLITSSFLIGSMTIYLFYNSDTDNMFKPINKQKGVERKYEIVIPLLKGDEKRIFQELIESKGEILQNALVLKSALSKVKIARILSSLENKNLIIKERHGLTNKIKLK